MRKRLGLAALALAGLLLAGGCTKPSGEGVATAGGAPGQHQSDPDQPASDPQERVAQFVACMRAEGIDLPDPEPGDVTGKTALRFAYEDKDKNEIGPAMEKCGHYLPQGGETQRRTPEQIQQSRLLAQCMRDNGVPTWPDPDADGEFKTGIEIDKSDPALRTALEKCRNPQESK